MGFLSFAITTVDPNKDVGKLQQIENFLRNSREGRGIFKTLDENRELLECLQQRAPEVLEKCPWIEGWIAGTDIFLVNLMILFGMENEHPISPRFPRPWPGTFPVESLYGHDVNLKEEQAKNESRRGLP